MGFIVGGPPQPPMVVPQAMEQLLRRPDALAGAQQAARDNDDELLAGYVFEAMRFDPLAPVLPRVAIAGRAPSRQGRRRERKGARRGQGARRLQLGHDGRAAGARSRRRSIRGRLPHEYIHFGYGLHQCFGIHINKALLPLMLKPLLKRPGLRRAAGSAGKLRKRGAFADTLHVEFDRT